MPETCKNKSLGIKSLSLYVEKLEDSFEKQKEENDRLVRELNEAKALIQQHSKKLDETLRRLEIIES